jgi:hypothetical protein
VSEITTRRAFTCLRCRHRFSLTSGTLLCNSKLPLETWLEAVEFFVANPLASKLSFTRGRMSQCNGNYFCEIAKWAAAGECPLERLMRPVRCGCIPNGTRRQLHTMVRYEVATDRIAALTGLPVQLVLAYRESVGKRRSPIKTSESPLATQSCNRCGMRRGDILCAIFCNGYCQWCYSLLCQYGFDEAMVAAHEAVQILKGESRDSEYVRPAINADRNNRGSQNRNRRTGPSKRDRKPRRKGAAVGSARS